MSDTTEFSDRQVTMLPRGANDLIKTAANRQFKRPSQYVREAVLTKLLADGFCLIAPSTTEKITRDAA
jgi:hypothetical protein